jgi:hypothetical protein
MNRNGLHTDGCEPEDGSTDGKFFLTRAADNQSWISRIIGTKWLTGAPIARPTGPAGVFNLFFNFQKRFVN